MRIFEKLKAKFSKENKFVSQQKLYYFYELVANDIESGRRDEGVWAKAYSEEKGRELETKARYIKLMADRLVLADDAAQEIQAKGKKIIPNQNTSNLNRTINKVPPKANRSAKTKNKSVIKSASIKKLEKETSEERQKRRLKERAEIARLRSKRGQK